MNFEVGDYVMAGRSKAHLCRITKFLGNGQAKVMELDMEIGHLHSDIDMIELWDVKKISPEEAHAIMKKEAERFNEGIRNFTRTLK